MHKWRVRFDAALAIQFRFGIRRGYMMAPGDVADTNAVIQILLGQ